MTQTIFTVFPAETMAALEAFYQHSENTLTQQNNESSETTASAQTRMLMIHQMILQHGPISLDHLQEQLPFSRSATYRALQKAVDFGWVQKDLTGTQFISTFLFSQLAGDATFGAPWTEITSQIVQYPNLTKRCYLDACVLSKDHTCLLIESTDAKRSTPSTLQITSSLSARAALCVLPIEKQVAFLKGYLATAAEAERRYAKTQGFANLFRSHDQSLIFWGDHPASAAIGVSDNRGQIGSIALRAKDQNVLNTAFKKDVWKMLSSMSLSTVQINWISSGDALEG